MSRWRPDFLYVGVDRDRMVVARLRRGRQPTLVDSAQIAVDCETPDGVAALRTLLADPRWQGTRACITLADRLLRYFLVERPEGTRDLRELHLAAAARFEEVFGETAEPWRLQLELTPFADNGLACALSRQWLTEIHAAFTQARIPVEALTGLAIVEWNRLQSQKIRDNAWFVVAGSDSLWAGRRAGKRWLNGEQHRWQGELTDELPRILQREELRTSLASSEPVVVTGDHGVPGQALENAARTYRFPSTPAWPGQTVQWSSDYRLALAPVWPPCA